MTRRQAKRIEGFTLIEILVALLMGLLAMVVIMQVFSVAEGQKRSTTGGADASTNAAAALYLLEREVKMGGWGLDAAEYMGRAMTGTVDPAIPGCATVNTYCDGDASCRGTAGAAGPIPNFSLASVQITDGAAGGPDAVAVRFFANPNNGNFFPPASGKVIANEPDPADATVPRLRVSSNYGCKKGDLILVSDPTSTTDTCTLMQVSDTPGTIATAAALTLPHKAGGADGRFNDPAWNTIAAGSLPTVPTGDTVDTAEATCFGHAANGALFERRYSIDTAKSVLQRTDNTGAAVVANEPVASGIVDMQVQYGIAADGAQNVTTWVDATAAAGWDKPSPKAGVAGATTKGRLQEIKAVRIALLARSSQYEKPTTGAGGACDATTGAPGTHGASGWSTWADFNTANVATYPAADWRCYRYRSFEIVLPLRNVIWANL
jgi:type IV pilus assembly protein PilW